MIAVVTIGLATAALGTPDAGHAPGRHPLKQRDCVMGCGTDAQTCLQEARAASAPCVEACQPLVAAARQACIADPTSDACTAAEQAARACLAPCSDVYRPAVRMCVEDGNECVQACPFIGEPPCLADCRASYVHCLAGARSALNDCRTGCESDFQAVRTACSDPTSTACTAARAVLQTCLQPCRTSLTATLDGCGSTEGQCVQACGVTPTPGTTP
jgi:hypothetical protein